MRHKRQTLIFDPSEHELDQVMIIGLGNIGSNTAVTLARMGVTNLFVVDPDTVEDHNLASQFYFSRQLGLKKGDAISDTIKAFEPRAKIMIHNSKMQTIRNVIPCEIMIVAVDSMKERKNIHRMLKKFPALLTFTKLIIDARVGGEQMEVYNCNDLDEWEKTFSDNPGQDPCGGRFIAYVSTIIGGIIAGQVKKFLNGEKLDKSIMLHATAVDVAKNFAWK